MYRQFATLSYMLFLNECKFRQNFMYFSVRTYVSRSAGSLHPAFQGYSRPCELIRIDWLHTTSYSNYAMDISLIISEINVSFYRKSKIFPTSIQLTPPPTGSLVVSVTFKSPTLPNSPSPTPTLPNTKLPVGGGVNCMDVGKIFDFR